MPVALSFPFFPFFKWIPITVGVPKGSELDPLLFLVMINDLKTRRTELKNYVDDTTQSFWRGAKIACREDHVAQNQSFPSFI